MPPSPHHPRATAQHLPFPWSWFHSMTFMVLLWLALCSFIQFNYSLTHSFIQSEALLTSSAAADFNFQFQSAPVLFLNFSQADRQAGCTNSLIFIFLLLFFFLLLLLFNKFLSFFPSYFFLAPQADRTAASLRTAPKPCKCGERNRSWPAK